MNIRTIDNLDVRGKYILLRDEFNVQIVDGKITDAFRIDQSLPTIQKLRDGGARIAICAHLGRPNGFDESLSLRPVAEYLNVCLISDCLDKSFLLQMSDGDVVLLENVRFYDGEEKNDTEFAEKLAVGFDIYVNDAFGVSHRAHASTVGITKFLPSYAGKLLKYEIENLTHVMQNPMRPVMAIIGGAKVSSKLSVLNSLVKTSDVLVVGGGIGTAFRIALGANASDSLYEESMRYEILKITDIARENNCKILMPIDKGVAKKFAPDAERIDKLFDKIESDDVILDESSLSIAQITNELKNVKTVIWNGPVGMAEWQPVWSFGTFAIARELARHTKSGEIFTVVGGGDVVAALEATGVADDISYVSTGGGAFLEFIENHTLPGIAVLEN